ncbi:hypothetical protein N7495_002563 [Penicillium taxi]|uniref:uncharacterized protein n=1 Tax=Penicillium taxi TaxID=168475 RepID=UPI002544D80F|nr:uncharacterized protein N7495_002563 [Penicillium taxi]KAJ5902035.1 hypothetical protein N7495_002563 [Penicillium taxi]
MTAADCDSYDCAPNQSGLLGFTLPLTFLHEGHRFPNALEGEEEYVREPLTYREILMMRVMNTITDKPDWEIKVFNPIIFSKWKDEISQSSQDVSPKMMDFIITELQWKAKSFEDKNSVTVFGGVIKSDRAIPEELKQALKDGVAPLESVPEAQKDYHPGSDDKVIDLVHPSLFPIVYGKTRILRDKTLGLDDCIGSIGQGEILPVPEKPARNKKEINALQPYSTNFQWLPCNVALKSGSDSTPECQISSYINNLHPIQHRVLYGVIEKIISHTIPLWNQTLDVDLYYRRITWDQVEYEEGDEKPEQGDDEDDEVYWTRYDDWSTARKNVQPEPGEFKPPQNSAAKLQDIFAKSGLQVIVKLANIELTPDKPDYEGGTWHIEGQLNEHIAATAIYYYDSENITESKLSFRHRPNVEDWNEYGYEQSCHGFMQQIFGFPESTDSNGSTDITQDLGSVVCSEGRLLTFPNVLQHCVSSFSLADRSKPGHRKILALFLVDPHVTVISTANVPPQQQEWGLEKEELVRDMLAGKLPAELQIMVSDEGILHPLMSLDEAKVFRGKLMKERSMKSSRQNACFETGDFNLCEH